MAALSGVVRVVVRAVFHGCRTELRALTKQETLEPTNWSACSQVGTSTTVLYCTTDALRSAHVEAIAGLGGKKSFRNT